MLCSWKEVTRGAYFMLQNVQDSLVSITNMSLKWNCFVFIVNWPFRIRSSKFEDSTKTSYHQTFNKSCHQTSRWLSSSASHLISYLINQIQGRWQKSMIPLIPLPTLPLWTFGVSRCMCLRSVIVEYDSPVGTKWSLKMVDVGVANKVGPCSSNIWWKHPKRHWPGYGKI